MSGEFKQHHKITVDLVGPTAWEGSTPSPFMSNRFTATFSQPDQHDIVVPGFFAADGDAAQTSAESGSVWRAYFRPPTTGEWTVITDFRTGTDAAVTPEASNTTAVVSHLTNLTSTFAIQPTDKLEPDFRAKGMLRYVGERYLRFDDGDFFLKVGADSPENLLGYFEFDGTYDAGGFRDLQPDTVDHLHHFPTHGVDWQPGDPVWGGAAQKGKNLIGALNYLASEGMNAFSFLTYNWGGDGRDVWPFRQGRSESENYDVSKLAQWELVMEHAERLGIFLHIKMQETENDEQMDNGDVGRIRSLYYRELVARFGHHLALNWNLGEENSQKRRQRKAMTRAMSRLDPYGHHIVIHNASPPAEARLDSLLTPLLGTRSMLTGASIQVQCLQHQFDPPFPACFHQCHHSTVSRGLHHACSLLSAD